MKTHRKTSCILCSLAYWLALIACVLGLRAQAADPAKTTFRKTDGTVIDLPYLSFDIARVVVRFDAKDGGETEVPAAELTMESLAEIASLIPPVAGWLAPDKAHVCVRAGGALDQRHEEEAAQWIFDAAKAAPTLKERIALFQLHSIVHRLLKADHERIKMEDVTDNTSVPAMRKLAQAVYEGELAYANRHAINPLTGKDQKTPLVEQAERSRKFRLDDCTRREERSKRELMLCLASCNVFARYCEISGRAAYAKELDELRAKIRARKSLTHESEPIGLAMVAWITSRVALHHHSGNNAALLKGIFDKMQKETKMDQAMPQIFYDRPLQDIYKLRELLVTLTGERLQQSDVGDRMLERRLRKGLREVIPDEVGVDRAMEQITPFLQEAIRMGCR